MCGEECIHAIAFEAGISDDAAQCLGQFDCQPPLTRTIERLDMTEQRAAIFAYLVHGADGPSFSRASSAGPSGLPSIM